MDSPNLNRARPIFVGSITEANSLINDTCALDRSLNKLWEYHVTLNSDLRREQGASTMVRAIQDYVFSIPGILCYSFAIDYNKKGFIHAHLWIGTTKNTPYALFRMHWMHNSYVTPVYHRGKIFTYLKLHRYAPDFLEDTIPYELEPAVMLLKK